MIHHLPPRAPNSRRPRSSEPPRPPPPSVPPPVAVLADGLPITVHVPRTIHATANTVSPLLRSADLTPTLEVATPEIPEVHDPSFPPLFPDPPHHLNPPLSQPPQEVILGGDSAVQFIELVALREKDITKRIKLKNGIRDLEYQWQHAAKAQEKFMIVCSNMMTAFANKTVDASQENALQDAWKHFQNLSGHVKSRELGLGFALLEVFALENKLYVKENLFYERYQGIVGMADFSGSDDDEPMSDTDHHTAISAPDSNSTATTRSIAHNYYSRIADINLLRERIFNHDSEHLRQQAIREAQRNVGHRVEPSDKAFIKQFLDEKAQMAEDYVFAKARMEDLGELCAKQGVEVEPPNLPPFLDHTFRVGRSIQDELSGDDENNEAKPERLSRYLRKSEAQNRVTHWVRGLQMSRPADVTRGETWDSLSENTGPHTIGITDEQVEDLLSTVALYNHLKPPPSEKTIPITKDKPENLPSIPERFHEEMPKRRYSVPDLPTFLYHATTEEDTLELLDEDQKAVTSQSCVLDRDDSLLSEKLLPPRY